MVTEEITPTHMETEESVPTSELIQEEKPEVPEEKPEVPAVKLEVQEEIIEVQEEKPEVQEEKPEVPAVKLEVQEEIHRSTRKFRKK